MPQFGEHAGEVNVYLCEACERYVVTINRDDGVTPMFLACRVKGEPTDAGNDCDGRMHSLMYPPLPWPTVDGKGVKVPTEPSYEWYAPAGAELKKIRKRAREDDGTYDHVRRGGLLLRRIVR